MTATLLLSAWLLAPVEERYALAYRPKLGERTKTTVAATYKVGGPAVIYRYDLVTEVLQVERDGTFRAKSEVGSKLWKIGDGVEIRNEAPIGWEARYNARGEELPDEETDEPEEDDPVSDLLRLAAGFEPVKPVALGENWTPPMDERLNLYPLKYTLTGATPTELMLEGKGPGRDGANLNVKLWLDAKTYARRRSEIRITEAPTETGNDGEVLVHIESKPL